MIGVLVNGKVATTFEAGGRGGFTRLLGDCDLPLAGNTSALAIAYRSGGDGSSTLFLLLGFVEGKYSILDSLEAPRSRIAVGQVGEFSLWEGLGSRKCVWCAQKYRVTKYTFNGKLFKKGRSINLLAAQRDPGEIADVPLIVEHSTLDSR